MNTVMPQNICKRCGRCMSVCPVYQTSFKEADVARGRLAILEKMAVEDIRRSRRMPDILSRCLMCGACGQACANDVDPLRWVQQGRQYARTNKKGLSAGHRLIQTLERGNIPASLWSKGGAVLEALLCRKIPASSGLHLRFPFSFFSKRLVVPQLAWKPFLNPALKRRRGEGPKRVAFFVGCGANFLFPETAHALVRILAKMGIALEIPLEQGCCGLPAYASGDMEKAKMLARKNLEVLGKTDYDALITVCASCGAHLERMGRYFLDDPVLGPSARKWTDKHRDATHFLVEELALDRAVASLPGGRITNGPRLHVAYHDPCHLRLGQGGTEAPRTLLQALPEVTLLAPAQEGLCCGHGGHFNLLHFDVSMKILARRMAALEKGHPDVIATGCTGCLLQFQEGVARHGLKDRVTVCHPLELVDRAIRKGSDPRS